MTERNHTFILSNFSPECLLKWAGNKTLFWNDEPSEESRLGGSGGRRNGWAPPDESKGPCHWRTYPMAGHEDKSLFLFIPCGQQYPFMALYYLATVMDGYIYSYSWVIWLDSTNQRRPLIRWIASLAFGTGGIWLIVVSMVECCIARNLILLVTLPHLTPESRLGITLRSENNELTFNYSVVTFFLIIPAENIFLFNEL